MFLYMDCNSTKKMKNSNCFKHDAVLDLPVYQEDEWKNKESTDSKNGKKSKEHIQLLSFLIKIFHYI